MSPECPLSLTLSSAEKTADLAVHLAPRLGAGDVILLAGPIGAGKTHFARSLIQALLPVPEDVPSPTFTLVQCYDGPGVEIWHSDLYRLGHPDEVIELGLTDAFDTAICLVEWPDRLGDLAPADALTIDLQDVPEAPDARRMRLTWSAPKWDAILKDIPR